jgi:hypothetical protein
MEAAYVVQGKSIHFMPEKTKSSSDSTAKNKKLGDRCCVFTPFQGGKN